jgi:cyanophycinase
MMAALALAGPGSLFLVGGGSTPQDVVDAFLDKVGRGSLVVVLGQVREEPSRAESSRELLVENGARMAVLIPFDRLDEVKRPVAEKLLSSASGIWVPGGDQNLLLDRFGLDWCRRVIGSAVKNGASYFGTSAGAMLASDLMIAGNAQAPGTTEYRPGLGLWDLVVDSHFRERTRQPRLEWTLRQHPGRRGIGLSEGEWVRVDQGRIAYAKGSPWLSP